MAYVSFDKKDIRDKSTTGVRDGHLVFFYDFDNNLCEMYLDQADGDGVLHRLPIKIIETKSSQMTKDLLGFPEFDESTDYAIDDVVLYNDGLYKFTSEHTAGAWVGSDAEATTVKELLS